MKKKSFLSGISAKIALLVLAVSGALLTGCYKDDGLDASAPGGGTTVLDDAVYTITGSVTDITTGANIPNAEVTCEGQSVPVTEGVYSVKIAKFTSETKVVTLTFAATGYNDGKKITRTVTLNKVEDGQAVVYPLSVAMRLSEQKTYPVEYKVNFVVKDSKTGAAVTTLTTTPADGFVTKGGEAVKVTTPDTEEYNSSVTVVTLPEIYSDKEGEQKSTIVEVLVTPKDPADDTVTYTTLSGNLVDINGKAVQGTIVLWKDGAATDKKVENANHFNFTLNDKDEAGEYKIVATSGDYTVESGIYTIPGCGNQSFALVFTEIGAEKPVYEATYKLSFGAKNDKTFSDIEGVEFVFNGQNVKEIAGVAAGTYKVKAYANNYYTGETTITLPVVKKETQTEVEKTITVFMTEMPAPAVETITLYGEIVDANGNMIKAQSIKLDGTSIDASPIYNSDHFKFVVPVEKAKEVNANTWTVIASVKRVDTNGKELTPVTISQMFTYTGTGDALYANVLLPYVTKDGVLVVSEEEDGEQGVIEPDVNEKGEVLNDVTVEMKGDGSPEQATTVTIEAGTIITNSAGAPLDLPIILTRNTTEEKNPSFTQEDETDIVIRSFFGNPDGAKFNNKPLKITFADIYGGQLGGLELQYKTDNGWGISTSNLNNEVTTDNSTYTMLVSHFSQFRAAINGKLESVKSETMFGEEFHKDVNQQNNTDKSDNLIVTYNNAQEGSIYNGLSEAISAVYTNENAQGAVNSAIKNVFQKSGMAIGDDFKTQNVELKYAVAPYTLVKSIKVKTEYKIDTYEFTLNGKKVEVVVKSVLRHLIDAETVYLGHGHNHGHGHGDDLNSGGGIFVGE